MDTVPVWLQAATPWMAGGTALLAFREKRDPRFHDVDYMELLAAELQQS